jgi:hypothetical protein
MVPTVFRVNFNSFSLYHKQHRNQQNTTRKYIHKTTHVNVSRPLEGHYQEDFPVGVFGESCDKIVACITSTYFLANSRDLVPIRITIYYVTNRRLAPSVTLRYSLRKHTSLRQALPIHSPWLEWKNSHFIKLYNINFMFNIPCIMDQFIKK